MRGRAESPLRGRQVLAWLRESKALGGVAQDEIEAYAHRHGCRIEDAVVESGALRESELLKLLAARYGTRFVSTDRLARANIDAPTLKCLPREQAVRLGVFPVVYDRRNQTLSVVVAAPGEDEVEKQVQVLSGVREVRSYVALPSAIRAAIEKHHDKNPRAFAELLRRAATEPAANPGSESDELAPLGRPATIAPRPIPAGARAGTVAPPPQPKTPTITPLELDDSPLSPTPQRPGSNAPTHSIPNGSVAYVEMLSVLVTLLERDRGELRGHSARVAKTCQRIGKRVGMSETDLEALEVAAYLHDVGKSAAYHLTAFNVTRYEGYRKQAQRTHQTPARLLAGAALPEESKRILKHLYERWDGQGFPDRLAGKDIPYGARVLAIAETFVDLVTNSENPYRRVLSASQALSVVRDLGGQLFDPTLAEVLVHLAIGEQADDALSAKHRALIVDSDPEETTVIELRLIEHGFSVAVTRSYGDASEILRTRAPHLVITEVDLGAGPGGFELAERINEMDSGRPSLIFLTARSDRAAVSRGFELGAVDYLVKPAAPELVATKAKQAVDRAAPHRGHGVSGSLTEMSLPDVVQILSNGRRGGRLEVTSGSLRGEIYFCDGEIHDARMGEHRAEEAVYALLRLEEGSFTLDTSFVPDERAIHMSAEGLLLEGMRRLDEGIT